MGHQTWFLNSGVECLFHVEKAVGSNPTETTKHAVVAQLDKARSYEDRWCRFESCQRRQVLFQNFGSLAQLVERLHDTQEVHRFNPCNSHQIRRCSSTE